MDPTPPPKLTLVIGGASSGKSAYAERLAGLPGMPRCHIATAEAFDAEMAAKIARHRAQRGTGWITRDAPHDVAGALRDLPARSSVLLDCATLWLSNRMLADADLAAETERLIMALAACPAPVVVVSNETGQGIVPDNALARRFREAQGRLNQRLAAEAALVVAVIAGLPLVLKGRLPGGLA